MSEDRIELLLHGDDTGARIATAEDGTTAIVIVPPSQRPHYLREVAANGRIVWHSEAYATRANARRAARRFDLPVWEFDAAGVRVK
jgi:hypothetical protein